MVESTHFFHQIKSVVNELIGNLKTAFPTAFPFTAIFNLAFSPSSDGTFGRFEGSSVTIFMEIGALSNPDFIFIGDMLKALIVMIQIKKTNVKLNCIFSSKRYLLR